MIFKFLDSLFSIEIMKNEDEAIEEGRLWHVVVNGSWHWYGHNLFGRPALSCGLGNSVLHPNWSCDL